MAPRLLDLHEVDQLAAAGLDDQRQGRLLQHRRVHLADPQRVEHVGADGGELHGAGVDSRLIQQEQEQGVVGVAKGGDPDGAARQRRHRADGAGLRRGRGEREQRQPPGGGHPADRGAVGGRLQRDVERRAGIVDGAAHQRLHRRVPAAGVDELDGQPLRGEVPAHPRDLVGHDAQELAAEGEPDGGRAVPPVAAATADRDDPGRAREALERGAPIPPGARRRPAAVRRVRPGRRSANRPQQARIRRLAAAHGGDHTTGRRPCYDPKAPS